MASNQYSKEEIERKRQLALQLAKERKQNTNKSIPSPSGSTLLNSKTENSTKITFGKYQSSHYKPIMKTNSQSSRFNPIQTNKFFSTHNAISVSFEMVNFERFKVEMSKFNDKLISAFKTIPSKYYDATTKVWTFGTQDYECLLKKLEALKSEVSVSKVPPFVLQLFKKYISVEERVKDVNLHQIDNVLVEKLMPFQREGVCYGISKGGRCMIADDMGLGKTIQALGIAHYYKSNWPLLIVTPSSVRYQWSDAIFKFLPSVPSQAVQHFAGKNDYIQNEQITIVSYDALTRNLEMFESCEFGVLILDESHFLKNNKTNRTKAVVSIAKNVPHIILLSGTPALSRPIELYSQIKLVMPKFMGVQDYGSRYCNGQKKAYGWDFSGSSHLAELQLLLNCCGLIRRLKADVMDQLPSKIREVVILDPNLIKNGSKEMRLAKSKSIKQEKQSAAEHRQAILEYYSETSKVKVKAVCNYLMDVLESQQKFLIFGHHKVMLNGICELLESKKVGYIKIDGATSPEHRKSFVDSFQENDDVLVAVLSINAANAGITLTAATLVIFAELTWNPGILSQAEDRAHRIGQTNTVVIRYLIAKDTVDDHLWPMLQKKTDILNKAGLEHNMDVDLTDSMKPTELILDNFVQKYDQTDFSLTGFMESFENKRVQIESPAVSKQLGYKQSNFKSNEVKERKAGQSTLDSFLEPTESFSQETNDLTRCSDSANSLLDLDDDAFDQIDLDNFVV